MSSPSTAVKISNPVVTAIRNNDTSVTVANNQMSTGAFNYDASTGTVTFTAEAGTTEKFNNPELKQYFRTSTEITQQNDKTKELAQEIGKVNAKQIAGNIAEQAKSEIGNLSTVVTFGEVSTTGKGGKAV